MYFVFIFIMMILTYSSSEDVGHVVIFALPLLGHIVPLLDFAKQLSMHHHVTYVVSASALDILEHRGLIFNINEKNSTLNQYKIEFIGLFDDNTFDPTMTESSMTINFELILDRIREPIIQLFPSLSESMSKSSSPSSPSLYSQSLRRPVSMIISDIFNPVPITIAHQRKIPAHIFMTNSFGTLSILNGVSKGKIVSSNLKPQLVQQFFDALSLVDGFISNSIGQLEEPFINELRSELIFLSNLPIRFVAPLMSTISEREEKDNNIVISVKKWLDDQWQKSNESASVIYISFGSVARLVPEQIVQIANALSSYPVIWSLKIESQIHLISSFKENPSHLIMDWSPQRLILFHPAIRLFISHGGWNSLLETMSAGKPVLVWPRFGDQFFNGKRLENQFNMGRMVDNVTLGQNPRILLADEITKYLNEIFDREKNYIEKAQQIKQIIINAKENSSRQHLEEIVNLIKNSVRSQFERNDEL